VRTIDGLAVTESGAAGPTILWIHGYTLDSTIWPPLWTLMPEWHHVGIDLPGHGDSEPWEKSSTLVSLARRIGHIAEIVDAEHLVALSFGGMVAMQVAIECPQQFTSLTLNSPALGGGPQDRQSQARHLELLNLYKQKGPGPWLRDLWMTSPPDIFAGASRDAELWSQLRDVVTRHKWSELGDGTMASLTSHQQTAADLRRIDASTLVVIGEEDMAAFKRCAELVRRAVSGSRRAYLPGAGHLGLVEKPELSAHMLQAHLASAIRAVTVR
jgi:pimeloyl-ACP methyl ester carboxylesterase